MPFTTAKLPALVSAEQDALYHVVLWCCSLNSKMFQQRLESLPLCLLTLQIPVCLNAGLHHTVLLRIWKGTVESGSKSGLLDNLTHVHGTCHSGSRLWIYVLCVMYGLD